MPTHGRRQVHRNLRALSQLQGLGFALSIAADASFSQDIYKALSVLRRGASLFPSVMLRWVTTGVLARPSWIAALACERAARNALGLPLSGGASEFTADQEGAPGGVECGR